MSENGVVLEVIEGVHIAPTKGGVAAYSPEWGVAAAGANRDQALQRLGALVALLRRIDERIAARDA